jgi:hypothetical protein
MTDRPLTGRQRKDRRKRVIRDAFSNGLYLRRSQTGLTYGVACALCDPMRILHMPAAEVQGWWDAHQATPTHQRIQEDPEYAQVLIEVMDQYLHPDNPQP